MGEEGHAGERALPVREVLCGAEVWNCGLAWQLAPVELAACHRGESEAVTSRTAQGTMGGDARGCWPAPIQTPGCAWGLAAPRGSRGSLGSSQNHPLHPAWPTRGPRPHPPARGCDDRDETCCRDGGPGPCRQGQTRRRETRSRQMRGQGAGGRRGRRAAPPAFCLPLLRPGSATPIRGH